MIKKSDILIIDKENGLREWLLMLTQERYRLITEAVEKNQAVTVEQGDNRKSVVVTGSIQVVNAMSKVYMTITVA